NGSYVVTSSNWNGNRGAATWGSGTTGVTGEVSAANSLVGSTAGANPSTSGSPGDSVGSDGVTALSNGNYVVGSSFWNTRHGAATWGSGTVGVTGAISAANSLVGSAAGDGVGFAYPLSNGNYVVASSNWGGSMGAVTWANGATGAIGVV